MDPAPVIAMNYMRYKFIFYFSVLRIEVPDPPGSATGNASVDRFNWGYNKVRNLNVLQ